MSYQGHSPHIRANAYDDTATGAYLDAAPGSGDAARATMPTVDITTMGNSEQKYPYQPYGGAYSESAWNAAPVPSGSGTGSLGNSLDMPKASVTTATEKGRSKHDRGGGGGGGVVGMKQMGGWSATQFVVYVLTRLIQLAVALVCIGFQADSRGKRPDDSVGGVENNVELAIYAIAGVTAGTAALSIVIHIFSKTRQRIEKSRFAWFTMVFNFAVFAVWIVLVLINIIVVDCSRKNDGGWCRSTKASLATGLISAMLSLVVTLHSFSILVRTNRVQL
ncbi:hypothetical protein GGF46_001069 [Coemansia sp. RSA 552]|nr:hypothetical protein GGF46_001069 [Coemansia sp. RSA 552]